MKFLKLVNENYYATGTLDVSFFGDPAASYPSARIQAAKCPDLIFRNSGSTCAHSAMANGQRVRKRQPEGGFIGVGTSPVNTIRSLLSLGSGKGIAESSAFVYG